MSFTGSCGTASNNMAPGVDGSGLVPVAAEERGVRDLSPRLWKLYNFLIWSNRFRVEFDI